MRATSIRSRRTSTNSLLRRADVRSAAVRGHAGAGVQRDGWRRCRISTGPRQFYPQLPADLPAPSAVGGRLRRAALPRADAGGAFAFRLARQPATRSFCSSSATPRAAADDVRIAASRSALSRSTSWFEERARQRMTKQSLTFANGRRFGPSTTRRAPACIETRTTTISADDIATRTDTCQGRPIRLLTVSRIDPRKGLRVLPEAVAILVREGTDVTLDIVGPAVGRIGEEERDAIREDATAHRRRRSRRAARSGAARLADAALSRLRRLRAADASGRRHSARAARSDGRRPAGRDDQRRWYSQPGARRRQRAAARRLFGDGSGWRASQADSVARSEAAAHRVRLRNRAGAHAGAPGGAR